MDMFSLVEGGPDGLVRIAEAFRGKGVNVVGLYMIKTTSHDDEVRWTIRLITDQKSPHIQRNMIVSLIDLRRTKALPWVDDRVLIDIVNLDDPEASRIVEYARALGGRTPVIIQDEMWDNLFIEHAVVAIIPAHDKAAA